MLLAALAPLAGCYLAPIAVAPAAACLPEAGNAVAAAVNAARAERDLPALAVDPRLVGAAADHTADMAANGFVGHTGSDGSSLAERIAAAGFVAVRAGEVVAAGQASAEAAVDAWMRSRRHRDILLRLDMERVGAACVADPRGALFWAAVVGAEPAR